MISILGPVSGATPNGGGPFWNILVVLVGVAVLTRVWAKYLDKYERHERLTRANVVGISLISIVMIALGIVGLFSRKG